MKLQNGNIAVDVIALRKQLNLRTDERAEAYHIEEFFKGKRWHVLADAGGSPSTWDKKRFIGSNMTYAGAVRVFSGWQRDRPLIVYFEDDGTAKPLDGWKNREEALKNKLDLIERGIIPASVEERNKIICELDPSKVLEYGPDRGPDVVWYGLPNGKVYYTRFFGDRAYTPLVPQADTDRLAAMGDRLIFRHGDSGGQPELFVQAKDILASGWAVGLMQPAPAPAQS